MADEAAAQAVSRGSESTLSRRSESIDEVWEELLRDVMEQGARQARAQALTEYRLLGTTWSCAYRSRSP